MEKRVYDVITSTGQTLICKIVRDKNGVYIKGGVEINGDLIIPNTVNLNDKEYLVVGIDANAFANCSKLKKVTMPKQLEYIGDNAFARCTGISAIELPPTVKHIGNFAFYGCEGIKGIELSEKLTYIGENAFCECVELREITIPYGVKKILYGTFNWCCKLKKITLHEHIKEIGAMAFFGCEYLNEIKLPLFLNSIGEKAFGMCDSLEDITIPSFVSSIGKDVFKECYKLKDIYVLATTPPKITDMGIEKVNIHIPTKSLKLYCDSENWKQFKHIYGIDTTPNECTIKLDDLKNFMAMLFTCRKECGLSRAKVSKATGITQQQIKYIEDGIHTPRTDTLMKMLKLYGYELTIKKMS